jgi:hypothetical protein
MNVKTICILNAVLIAASVIHWTDLYSQQQYVKAKNLEILFSDEGRIVAIKSGKNNLRIPAIAYTEIAGTRQSGALINRRLKDGSLEFERTLISDSLKTQCRLIDRFIPTANSIRWEVIIIGNDKTWASAINTILNYPAGKRTGFWTSWGKPKYDTSIKNTLTRRLTPVPGGSTKKIIGIDNNNWVDPLIPVPFTNDTLYYGAPYFTYERPLASSFWPFQRNLFCIPMFTVIEEESDSGLSFVLSPEDDIIDLVMHTTAKGSATFSRLYNRISTKNTLKFSMDIISHEGDWRAGLGWMSKRYPGYFNPVNKDALKLNGTGAYSNSYATFDADKMKKMAFSVNWQASFDFPYMGMFLPPVQLERKWKRFDKDSISITDMNNYADQMRKQGFYVLNYFNISEFGAKIKYPAPARKASSDSTLWMDSNDFLYTKLPNAIVKVPGKMSRKNIYYPETIHGGPFYTWEGAVVLDCGDSAYRSFLLDQARRHVKQIPASYGIAIDRLDWMRFFNEDADDGISWFDGRPARSLVTSFKTLMEDLAPIMHDAGKNVLVNSISRRLDVLKNIDGIFDEYTYTGSPLNTTALLCINKPALGWTDAASTVVMEGGDNFFQKYLYMGVYPMCPFPGNDHSIQPDKEADKFYLDYGPLMQLIKERKWVLAPHVIDVEKNMAKANVFEIPLGYAIPVVYGKAEKAIITIRLPGIIKKFKCSVYYPGIEKPVDLKYKQLAETIIVDVPLIRGCGMVMLKT